MPIYDYLCEDCGVKQEVLVLSRNAEIKCKYCDSASMKRLYTVSNIIWSFKYPGWVNKMDDFQKRQVDRGEQPTVPSMKEIYNQ